MKLQQLRYLVEVADAGLNVSQAALNLHTSQPGVSKQIRMLENEIGVDVFIRNGKRIVGVTSQGQALLGEAKKILEEVRNFKSMGREFSQPKVGTLILATTHTQARYVLPPIILGFVHDYPEVRFRLHQGNPIHVAEEVVSGRADIAIATESLEQFSDLCLFTCYEWNRILIVPKGHPLLDVKKVRLEHLLDYPLITYDSSFTGRSQINKAFEAVGATPNVILSALDSDVIKTYVALNMGIGLIAQMAYDPKRDHELASISVAHLFAPSTTRLALRRGAYLRQYHYDFMIRLAPHLNIKMIKDALGVEE